MPSSLTVASRLNFASEAGSAGVPSFGKSHDLRRAEIISASVLVFCGSLCILSMVRTEINTEDKSNSQVFAKCP